MSSILTNSTESTTVDVCPVSGHSAAAGLCPASVHAYRAPGPTDSRSPCPALNALANHGYLPHNGQHIHVRQLSHALQKGYGLSTLLAWFLSFGGFLILGQFRSLSLHDLARHNCIEHDASVTHEDTPEGEEYAHNESCPCLVNILRKQTETMGGVIKMEEVAQIRVTREDNLVAKCLDPLHAEIARGELAIAVGVLGGPDAHKHGIPASRLIDWLVEERLPENWEPTHTQGFFKTVGMATQVRNHMAKLRAQDSSMRGPIAI